MNPLHTHFPPRLEGDAIDVAPLLEQGLRQAPGRVVFVFEGQAVTCGELRERIDRLRAWLAAGVCARATALPSCCRTRRAISP